MTLCLKKKLKESKHFLKMIDETNFLFEKVSEAKSFLEKIELYLSIVKEIWGKFDFTSLHD